MTGRARLIVSGAKGWLRAALLDGGDLIEAAVDAPGGPAPDAPGAVILGRVKTVSKPLDAAFVNIGAPHDGFLPLAETVTPPHEGQALCVRVTAPGAGGKGPKLSAKLAPPDDAAASAKPPQVLAPAPEAHVRLMQGLPAGGAPGEILCDTAGALHTAAACAAGAEVRLWNRPEPLFEASGAQAAVDAALEAEITLPGGGRITAERTKLGVVIDVDSAAAGGSALAVNLEAAAAAARTLRARNLSGLIVADFMRMPDARARQKVLSALRAAAKSDPAGLHIGGFTGLGLVEMTRARRGPALEDALRGFA